MRVAVLSWVVLALAGSRASPESATYALLADESSVMIQVGRSGVFGFAGHTHEVKAPAFQGEVVADTAALERSSVRVQFEAGALKVTGKGEPAKDVPKVQEAMVGEKVLDVARHPSISFRSRSVEGRKVAPDVYELVVHGELSLHGATHGVDLPVRVELKADTLTATGKITLRHTDFGMKPISVGGVVNVKNELGVELRVVARKKT